MQYSCRVVSGKEVKIEGILLSKRDEVFFYKTVGMEKNIIFQNASYNELTKPRKHSQLKLQN